MTLKRTPFYEIHKAAGGKLVPFAGYEMPVQFSGILDEHRTVRESAGIFDVSHMGEVRILGARALEVVQRLVSNDVSLLVDGQAQYNTMCNERGTIVDDLIVYRFAADEFFLCINAACKEKDFQWMVDHNPLPEEVSITDESEQWAQLALQGRNAAAILQKLTPVDLAGVKFYHFATGPVAGVDGCILARTGYTGEDGFEVFIPPADAAKVWAAIVEAGADAGLKPIGLGARDTLRLEAKYCLYGNDITDETTPLEAGLGWVTALDKAPPFIGQDVLVAQKEAGIPRRLVALVVKDQIARQHHAILANGQKVGEITSGTRSPSLDQNIALGYVPREFARPGTRLQVEVRGRLAEAEVVKPPFYRRPY